MGKPAGIEQGSERQIRAAFLLVLLFALAVAVASLLSVRAVTASLGEVAFDDAAKLIAVQRLRLAAELEGRKARTFLLTGDELSLIEMRAAAERFARELRDLETGSTVAPRVSALRRVGAAYEEHAAALERVVAMRQRAASAAEISAAFELHVQPTRMELDGALADLGALHEARLEEARRRASSTTSVALRLLAALTGAGLVASFALAALLLRALGALRAQRRQTARYVDRLEQLNAELDAFAGRIAHDLRNALAPVGIIASLLHRADSGGAAPAGLAPKLQRAMDRCLAMLDGLLAFSRSGAPAPDAASSPASVLEEVLEDLAPVAERIGAAVECDVEDRAVACSRELLSLVVANLVGNALKFLEGRETRVVRIAGRSKGNRYELSVEDTGPGIPEEALGRVFEPFYRAPGSKAAGTGIGLATVRRIVAAHGGSAEARSKMGEGATFRVELPVVEVRW